MHVSDKRLRNLTHLSAHSRRGERNLPSEKREKDFLGILSSIMSVLPFIHR
jgi:hypothetical protein